MYDALNGEYIGLSDPLIRHIPSPDGEPLHIVRLAGLLNEAIPTPRLVVLNSCQSGRSGTQDLFSSTAATLVRRGISAVAAMQFSISDAGATKFARGLYSALASGRSIGDAIGSGRVGLLNTPGSLEWVTPVLYVRGNTDTLPTIMPPARPQPAVAATRAAESQTRTGPSKKVLTIIGGIGAAVVVGVVILVAMLSSPNPTPPAPSARTSISEEVASAPPNDPDALIRKLAAEGIDTTLPGGNAELATYLANSEYTPYPAIAAVLLDAIGTEQLRQPVAIDAIVFEYEVLAGAPPPNRADLVDVDVLKKAVAEEYASRYGGRTGDFQSLLVRR
jgi:hypothetical protein